VLRGCEGLVGGTVEDWTDYMRRDGMGRAGNDWKRQSL